MPAQARTGLSANIESGRQGGGFGAVPDVENPQQRGEVDLDRALGVSLR
jgi:hypothetical protein